MYAAAPLPQIQVTQEMQHLKEQVGQIDQLLRSQHPQPTLNSLNAQRIQLMAKLQSIARQQQGAQMMQYPQGTPQQSISQAMQWMHPHSQRAPRRQMADMKEVQHRALAKLHVAPAAVPDQLGPERAAAVQRRRALLEAHDELERNNTWMQELLSPCDTTTEQDPAKTWDAIRERLTAWQVPPSHTPPPLLPQERPACLPPAAHARLPPRHRRGASSCKRSSRRSTRGCARASSRRLGAPPPPAPPAPSPSLPPSPPCLGACRLSDLSRARVREVQDARRFNEALGALKQASSLKVRHVARTPACGRSASPH